VTPPGGASGLDPAGRRDLSRAVDQLEAESFALRLANYAGSPIHKVVRAIPAVNAAARRAVHSAMLRSLEVAIDSLEEEPYPPSGWLPKAMTGFTGGVGGLFGAAALAVELPLTTTLMLRSIADIARHHGENLSEIEPRLACLEVFALGGRKAEVKDDLGYYAARAMFAKLSSDLISHLMERSVIEASAPVVTRLLSAVASRFGVVISERAAATAVPVLGALSGAALNMVFMDHFERVAHGHFTLRRLERIHGQGEIRDLFDEIAQSKRRATPPPREKPPSVVGRSPRLS
jgi:hypothetical protein